MKYEGVSKMSEISMLEAVKNCLIRRKKYDLHFASHQTTSYIYYQTPRYVHDVLAMTLSWKVRVHQRTSSLQEKFEMLQDKV